MILESKNIPYTAIDITDPGNEESKDYMVETAQPKEGCKIPVTPQLFNEADYCGVSKISFIFLLVSIENFSFQDYDGLDMANECDTLGEFLKLSDAEKSTVKIGITGIGPKDSSAPKEENLTNGREVGAC